MTSSTIQTVSEVTEMEPESDIAGAVDARREGKERGAKELVTIALGGLIGAENLPEVNSSRPGISSAVLFL